MRKKLVLSLISILLIMAFIVAFSSCAKVPTEEITTGTEAYTLVNNYPSSSESKTESDVEFAFQSYYKFNGNYASVSNVRFDEDDMTVNAKGFVDVKMIYIEDKSQDMYIGYNAYDANGEILRTSYLVIDLDSVRSGKTVKDIRFDIPYETVKVEFFDYVEA